jgi:hypothetical protein
MNKLIKHVLDQNPQVYLELANQRDLELRKLLILGRKSEPIRGHTKKMRNLTGRRVGRSASLAGQRRWTTRDTVDVVR